MTQSLDKKPRRRWWQRVIRWGVALATSLALAYVALPWWVPTGLIREYLAADLARQSGVAVSIDSLTLSWATGVELRGLTIASPPGFDGTMVQAPLIRADLSPLRLLLLKRLAWMDIEGLRVQAKIDEAGNANVAALARLKGDIQTDRLSLREATLALELPHHDHRLALHVRNAQYRAGKLQPLGDATLSAALDQQGQEAPVVLQLLPSPAPDIVARAGFSFANVDLAQLGLIRLLGLPLTDLAGRCRGQLDVQVNRDGVVEQLGLNITVADLAIATAQGPHLPTLQQAQLAIDASLDPLTRQISLKSASVVLPGVELQARGSLVAGASLCNTFEVLDLQATAQPQQLAQLLTGRPEVWGDLVIEGPVALDLKLGRQGSQIFLGLSADARSATFRRGPAVLKPAQTDLSVFVFGKLDLQTGRFETTPASFKSIRLRLGGNHLECSGAIHNLPACLDLLEPDAGPPSQRLARLLEMDGRGSFELADLPALARLDPAAARALEPLALTGAIQGRWSIDHFAGTTLALTATAPEGVALRYGEILQKPPQIPLSLSVSAKLDSQARELEIFDVDLSAGEGRLSVDGGHVLLAQAPATQPAVTARGYVSIQQLERLVECSPLLGRALGPAVGGALEGQYTATLAPDTRRVDLTMDLRHLRIDAGDLLRKNTAAPGGLELSAAQSDTGIALSGLLTLAPLSLRADVHLPADTARHPPTVDARLRVEDLRALRGVLPRSADILADEGVRGPVDLHVRAALAGTGTEIDATLNADDAALALRGPVRRVKAAGTPLNVGLKAVVGKGPTPRLNLHELTAKLGWATATWSGQCDLDPAAWTRGDLGASLAAATLKGSLELKPNAALHEAAPDLQPLLETHGLAGRAQCGLDLRWDGRDLCLVSTLDATELTGQWALSDRPGERLTKPRGLKATLDAELTIPGDLSKVQLNHLELAMGDLRLLADATAQLERPAQDGWPRLLKAGGQLALDSEDLKGLSALWPGDGAPALRGGLFADVAWTYQDGQAAIPHARLEFRRTGASFQGRELELSGAIWAQSFAVSNAGWTVGKLDLRDLGFRAGVSRGWLNASLADLPAAPKGRFDLTAVAIHDAELAGLFSSSPTTRPATGPAAKLTARQKDDLRASADGVIDTLRGALGQAQVQGQVFIDRLVSYDKLVEQSYTVRQFRLDAALHKGAIDIAYAGGLNGGTIENRYRTDLAEKQPVLALEAQVRRVVATPEIQPQLAQYFPGNTVEGLFNRRQTSRLPLRDAIAQMIDHRLPLHPQGQAKTITTDGLLQGRAAPAFVTKVFPGLNLTRYRYKTMTSFADLQEGGLAVNDMVFSGESYDIYIEGTTDADNIGRYEIGLILLGSPQSAEWNHTYRQGRIPLLKMQARIENGRMHDEQVSFPWPNQTLFTIFLRNNLFYRLWLESRK